jgi:hypothetical protein
MTGASILIGSGDIASCSSRGDEMTARVVDSVIRVNEKEGVDVDVFAVGDNVYSSGTVAEHRNCWGPSWGDTAKLIMKNIRPAPGNHEYNTSGADPYYAFFGERAGPPGKGYYSYDIGKWHVAVLNSNIVVNDRFTAADRQAQMDWLDKDLKANAKRCTMAYWHHPAFSSGWHGNDARLRPFLETLYKYDADVVIVGHDHNYERFRPMTPFGVVDTTKGIVHYMIGTGGGELRGFSGSINATSVARIEGRFGVLMFALGGEEWKSAFIETNGRIWDSSGGKCH